ncbi:MAG: hypothetical protein AMJ68_11210 [Acidithiobacillales bacterium SG8_45]|nr:MAG: hypothetical protein AMJ68_11210 [Acidithiobacillales bacterium SG8_45]
MDTLGIAILSRQQRGSFISGEIIECRHGRFEFFQHLVLGTSQDEPGCTTHIQPTKFDFGNSLTKFMLKPRAR